MLLLSARRIILALRSDKRAPGGFTASTRGRGIRRLSFCGFPTIFLGHNGLGFEGMRGDEGLPGEDCWVERCVSELQWELNFVKIIVYRVSLARFNRARIFFILF